MHAARLNVRRLHALYQRLEPHGDAQSADFDAPRQPLLERITSPDFAFTSSLQCCAGTSSRLGMAHELVTSKLEVLNASRFSIRVFYAFNQLLEPHGDRHREDLVLFARVFSSRCDGNARDEYRHPFCRGVAVLDSCFWIGGTHTPFEFNALPRAIPASCLLSRDRWKILTSATRALEVADDFVTSLE